MSNLLDIVVPPVGGDFMRGCRMKSGLAEQMKSGLAEQMKSGLAEQMKSLYHYHKGKKEWCVAACTHGGDLIYVNGRPGGRTMRFDLAHYNAELDSDFVDFEGPWHSNSEALYRDTGVDYRDKHLTWCCVGTERTFTGGDTCVLHLLWRDDQPVVGRFDRQDALRVARDCADVQNRRVFLYKETFGGSSLTPIEPGE